jgi:hypothetical protein
VSLIVKPGAGAIGLVVLAFGSGAQEERVDFSRPGPRMPELRCSAPAIILRPGTCWHAHPMLTASLAPLDETITIAELTRDPYPIYKRLRREAPVLRVKSVGRTFLTKADDTNYVKDNAALFSSAS